MMALAESPVESEERQWYAVHVIYNKDRIVQSKFTSMGFTAILPLTAPAGGQ